MTTTSQGWNEEIDRSNWLPFLLIGGAAIAAVYFWRQPGGKFSEADKRFKKMLREEENQTRPFPKEVDLEPPVD